MFPAGHATHQHIRSLLVINVFTFLTCKLNSTMKPLVAISYCSCIQHYTLLERDLTFWFSDSHSNDRKDNWCLYSPLQVFRPWYFSSFSSHLIFRDCYTCHYSPVLDFVYQIYQFVSGSTTRYYYNCSPPGVLYVHFDLRISSANWVKMFLFTTPATWFLPGVVDIGFCYSGPVFVLPWLVPLCCLSIRTFQSIIGF